MLLVLALRNAGHVTLRRPATTLWSDILIGFPLILYLLVDNALAVGDRYVITLFMGITAVGAYQPAYQLGSLIIMIGRIASVILPRFLAQRVDSGEKTGAEALLARTVRIYTLLGMPFIFGSAMLARPLLRVLANTAISESAWTVVTPVAVGTVFYGLVITLSQAAYVSGATRTILIANTIGAVVDLVLVTAGIWLLPQLWVAGLATMIAYLVTFVYLFGQLRHDWTVRIDWPFTLKSLLAAAAMAALLALLGYGGIAPGASLVSLLLAILVATVTYFAVLALLRAYDERGAKCYAGWCGDMNDKRLIAIIGSGGHARVARDVCDAAGLAVAGFLDPGRDADSLVDGLPVLGGEPRCCSDPAFMEAHRLAARHRRPGAASQDGPPCLGRPLGDGRPSVRHCFRTGHDRRWQLACCRRRDQYRCQGWAILHHQHPCFGGS